MTPFTDRENDELLLFAKILSDRNVVPINLLETPIERLWISADPQNCPLKTAEEAILLNDMFASFLCSGKWGHVIAVSGGFRDDGQYWVVGAGNTGNKGVLRPSDELCKALGRACEEFILDSTMPFNPDDTSAILVASLDICHADVARRLRQINNGATVISLATSNTATLDEGALQLHGRFRSVATAIKDNMREWKGLKSQQKTEVATSYGQLLKYASELWDKIQEFGSIQWKRQVRYIYEFNTIAKGLELLRRFPRGTTVHFYWPQGPIKGDRPSHRPAEAKTWQTVIEDLINRSSIEDHELRNQMRMNWKETIGENQWAKAVQRGKRKLHCEIYLALYILFSESDVQFHAFQDEKTRLFTIGCSKESCIGCWDILLGLFIQDPHDRLIYVCRTRRSHGKCYTRCVLTPHVDTLPPSLRQAITGSRQIQMLKSLNVALKYSHQEFKQRVEALMQLKAGKQAKESTIKC